MLHSFSTKLGKVRPVWVLAGVMLLAAALRLWQLDVLPPGLFFDEAYNGFDARQVLEGVSRPLFFAANNGREPLFIYLQALSIALLGPTPFALRVVSAMVGILTIPIMYFCAYTVLRTTPSSPQGDRRAGWLALVAAAGLAVSYWHVSLSRVGFRAILLIPVSALAIAFFWRAWTEGRTWDYVLAGIALALALYTYIAARLLPFVVAAFVLVELALSLRAYRTNRTAWWSLWKPQLAGLLILAAVMAVGILPLAWTLLSTPTLVSARTDQVSILTATRAGLFDSIPQALLSNVLATARVFYDQGDQNLRHNLPGRPANDLLLAVLFTAGWLTALWRLREPRSRMVLLWFTIMLATTVLSTEAPHYLRGAGALPPTAVFYAMGAGIIADGVARALSSRQSAAGPVVEPVIATVLLLVLLVSGLWTAVDYFSNWARLPGLGRAFDLDLQLAADDTARTIGVAPSSSAALMDAGLFLTPQMAFALGNVTASTAQTAASPGVTDLRLLHDGSFGPGGLALVWRNGAQPASTWLEPLSNSDFLAAAPVGTLKSPLSQPEWPQLEAARLAPGTELNARQMQYATDMTFANGVRLLGYSVQPDTLQNPGESEALRLTLFWEAPATDSQVSDDAQGDFDAFVHLNAGGAVVQTNNGPINGLGLVSQLAAGHPVVEDVHVLVPPSDFQSGKAYFEVGLYHYSPGADSQSNDRIPLVDGSDRIDLGAVWLGAPPAPVDLAGMQPLEVQFDERFELMAASATTDPANPQALTVDLAWRGLDRSVADYSFFVHVLDEEGQTVAQHDAPPGGLQDPTHLWFPDEQVRSSFALTLPEDSTADSLVLRIGLYEPAGGRQLPITAPGDPVADGSGGTYVLIPVEQLRRHE